MSHDKFSVKDANSFNSTLFDDSGLPPSQSDPASSSQLFSTPAKSSGLKIRDSDIEALSPISGDKTVMSDLDSPITKHSVHDAAHTDY